jgi:hypothetical protein
MRVHWDWFRAETLVSIAGSKALLIFTNNTEVFLHRFRRGGVEPGGQPEEGVGGEAGGQVPEEADVLQGRVLCIRKDLFRVFKD